MFKTPHIFLTRPNQHTWQININSDGDLNHYGTIVFAENQEQNESYTFNYMLLQPGKSYFIISMIKEYEAHEAISHWTLMKIAKSKISTKIKMENSRMFYPFGLSSARYSHMEYELKINPDSVTMEE